MDHGFTPGTPRRGFLGQVAAAAVGVGAASLLPMTAHAAAMTTSAANASVESIGQRAPCEIGRSTNRIGHG